MSGRILLFAGALWGCDVAEPPPQPAPDANAYVCSCNCPSGVFTREVMDFPVCLPRGGAELTRDDVAEHCAEVVCPALSIAVHELGQQCMLDCRVSRTRRDGTPVWSGISAVQRHAACDVGCDTVDCDISLDADGNLTGNWQECTRVSCGVPRCADESDDICRPPADDFLDTGAPTLGRGG